MDHARRIIQLLEQHFDNHLVYHKPNKYYYANMDVKKILLRYTYVDISKYSRAEKDLIIKQILQDGLLEKLKQSFSASKNITDRDEVEENKKEVIRLYYQFMNEAFV